MKYDLAKTQFLLVDNGFTMELKAYRRKRSTMLIDRNGKPMRLMSWAEFRELKAKYPDEVATDGLRLETVWTLVEDRRKA